jgi:integrase/recombinase XerD
MEMKERIITAKAIAEFKEHLILEERSEITVEKYIRDVKAFTAYTQNTSITKETVIAYKKHLQENYAVRSVNSMLASINSLFAFLGWHELKVKSLKLQQQVFCPEDKELTKAEYARLCRTAERKHNERLNLILQTICGTGIRVSELQFITVEAVKQGEAVVNCKAKTRSVFIVRELKQKLLRYAAEQNIKSGMIFVTRTGKPISRTNIWREMKALCEESNVNPGKVFPHNLRHLFARVFYGIEKDIAKLADILGHSSINTTRIYIISTGTEHRQRMENMHLIM